MQLRHRYKGHAVRKNVAERHGCALLHEWRPGQDPWQVLFDIATKARAPGQSELIPCCGVSVNEIDCWVVRLEPGGSCDDVRIRLGTTESEVSNNR